jgi:lipopolysaccharide/colanic/teichoic acid biosynthesis glycosyltransferase
MNLSNYNPAREDFAGGTACGGSSTGPSPLAAKRVYDVFFSVCGLVILSPLFLLTAILIKIADGGPVFYRQRRVGLHGRPFLICKFRTMGPQADRVGPSVTKFGDTRITGVGRILRRTKLDELPQLWNVIRGEMSLVGPRPEVPAYVGHYTPEQRNILNLKPGITDLASIYFREEELLLRNAEDVEEFYVRHCVPRKLQLDLEYARRANLFSDTWIILQTICPYWLSLLSVYSLVLATAFWLSCQLIYDFALPPRLEHEFAGTMVAIVAVQLGSLIWRKQCKGLLSYFSLPELKQVATALGFACFLLLGLWALTKQAWPPRNLILVDSLLALCALSAVRICMRLWRENTSLEEDALDTPPVRVGIVGAGKTGSQLACELMVRKDFGRTVVAFFDDDFQKWHRCVHEIPVVGMPECLLDGWAGKLDEVVIAMPNAPSHRIREIDHLLRKTGLKTYTAPSAHSLWLGNRDDSSRAGDITRSTVQNQKFGS